MAFTITITNAGRAAIVNAQNTGTAPVTIAQIGLSPTAIVPAPTMTVLAGEMKRTGSIAGDVVANDTIHVTAMDESADVYSLRAFGLYLADGTLFAIYGQAAPILEKVAASIALLSVDVIFTDIDAAAITFGDASFINPPATTERQGVVELATPVEAQAGIDALRALTPSGARAAILGWLLAQDGSGSGLDADMLDGQHGAFYTNIPARLGYTPVQMGTGVGQLGNTVKIGWSPAYRLKVTIDTVDQGYLVMDGNIADVWRSSNDGSGSGLDADMLDGQHGSWYADIIGRLGYTPLNYYSYTAADVLAKVVSVDGSGSGLDADLLDGQQGSWYADIIGRLGYTPLNYYSYTAGDVLAKLVSVDGSGSGLDADLWRGKTPAQHIADYHSSGSNANGHWRKYPDGAGGFVIEQWGAVVLGTGYNVQFAAVTFPIEFTDAATVHISGNANKGANAGWNVAVICFADPTTTGSQITADSAKSDQYFNRPVTVRWRAVGR